MPTRPTSPARATSDRRPPARAVAAQRDIFTPSALWLCLRAAIVLAALPLLLARLPVARLVRLFTPRRAPAVARLELLQPAARWVDRVLGVLPFRLWGRCLPRSLALYYVATRAGYPARVVLGVRRVPDSGGVTGHSWLELDGAPFCEGGNDPEHDFVVMQRLPAAWVT